MKKTIETVDTSLNKDGITAMSATKSKLDELDKSVDIRVLKLDTKYRDLVHEMKQDYQVLEKTVEINYCTSQIDLNRAKRSTECTNFYTYLTLLVSTLLFLVVFSIRNYQAGDIHSVVVYSIIGILLLGVGIKTYLSFRKRSKHYLEEVDKYTKRLKKV